MSKIVLGVSDLKTYYKTRFNEKICAVDGVSFEIEAGKVLGIAGESGCGKSTLAVSLLGYYEAPLHYAAGAVRILGRDIIKLDKETRRVEVLGKEIAYIPQASMNALNPTLQIKKFIFDIMQEHKKEMKEEDVYKMAVERFENLNLPERVLESYPNELSGGMKQRTVIAISTIMNPEILVADEPSSALDVSSQKLVMKLLKALREKKIIKSMIVITHDLPLLYHVADDIMVMYAGESVEIGTAAGVVFEPYHPYSKMLMRSITVPEAEAKKQKKLVVPGVPPNLKYKITGCRFAERCEFAKDACRAGAIAMKIKDGRAYRCLF